MPRLSRAHAVLLMAILVATASPSIAATPSETASEGVASLTKVVDLSARGRPADALALYDRLPANLRADKNAAAAAALYHVVYDHVLLGQYAKAASAAAALEAAGVGALTPAQQQSVRDDAAIWGALAHALPMSIELRGPIGLPIRPTPLGHSTIPASANGHLGDWVIDTGANLSVVSASDARQLDLRILPGVAQTTGASGIENALRVGIIDELNIGPARLRNVPVLVLDDRSLTLPTPSGPYTIGPTLGYPVLRALHDIALSRSRGFLANQGYKQSPRLGAPLGVQALTPTAYLTCQGRFLEVSVDTGAAKTTMSERFYAAFPALHAALGAQRLSSGGAGGFRAFKGIILPALELNVGHQSTDLHNVQVLATPTGIGTDDLYGNVGFDLRGDHDVMIFDFQHGRMVLR